MSLTGDAASEVMYHLVTHDAHGYTQGAGREGTGRESIVYEGVELSFPGGDADCSDGVVRAWRAVGDAVGYNLTAWASYTGNIKDALLSTGLWEAWPVSRSDNAVAGDLMLCRTSSLGHVAMVSKDHRLMEFWINELGTITGGRPGDQTGWESRIRDWYSYPWTNVLHYKGPDYFAELIAPTPEPPKVYPEMEPDVAVYSDKMYRLCNPYNGQHMYTSSASERDALKSAGWEDEGIGWTMPMIVPVYRLNNPNNGDHLLTADLAECKAAINDGWTYEGLGGYGAESGTPVHRLYNPASGAHLFTTDTNEYETLIRDKWTDEGVAFNAV